MTFFSIIITTFNIEEFINNTLYHYKIKRTGIWESIVWDDASMYNTT